MPDEIIIVKDTNGSGYPHVGPTHVDPFPYTGDTDWDRKFWGSKRTGGAPQVCVNKLNTPFWSVGLGVQGGSFHVYENVSYFSCMQKQFTVTFWTSTLFPIGPGGLEYLYDMTSFTDGDGNFYVVAVDDRSPSSPDGHLIRVAKVTTAGVLTTSIIDVTSSFPGNDSEGDPITGITSVRGGGAIPQQAGFLVSLDLNYTTAGGASGRTVLVKINQSLGVASCNWSQDIFPQINGDPQWTSFSSRVSLPMPDGFLGYNGYVAIPGGFAWTYTLANGSQTFGHYSVFNPSPAVHSQLKFLFDNNGKGYVSTNTGIHSWVIGSSTLTPIPRPAIVDPVGPSVGINISPHDKWTVSHDGDRIIYLGGGGGDPFKYTVADMGGNVLIHTTSDVNNYPGGNYPGTSNARGNAHGDLREPAGRCSRGLRPA